MIRVGVAALLLLAFGGDANEQQRPRPAQGGSLTVRGQIIIRIPLARPPRIPAGAAGGMLVNWQEDRGPRCIAASQITHAAQMRQESVDLILRDNSRVRARLERRCPALDYYYGFYINQTPDGMICADRDSIRSRVGGECQIDQFRTLRPGRP